MSLINTWEFNLVMYLVFNVVFLQSYKAAVKSANNESAAAVTLQAIAGFAALVIAPIFVFRWPTSVETYLLLGVCLLYTSPSPRDRQKSRMPSSA